MKSAILIMVLMTGCGAMMSTKGVQVQDCATTHIKAISRNGDALSSDLYDKIIEACNRIFDGRP